MPTFPLFTTQPTTWCTRQVMTVLSLRLGSPADMWAGWKLASATPANPGLLNLRVPHLGQSNDNRRDASRRLFVGIDVWP